MSSKGIFFLLSCFSVCCIDVKNNAVKNNATKEVVANKVLQDRESVSDIATAIEIVFSDHPTLKAFAYSMEKINAEKFSKILNLFPSFEVSHSYGLAEYNYDYTAKRWNKKEKSVMMGGSPGDQNLTFQANLNVFKGGADILNISKSLDDQKIKEAELEKQRLGLIKEVFDAYIELLTAQETSAIYKKELQQNQQILEKVRIQIAIGEKPQTDMLQAESSLKQTQSNIFGTENSLRSAREKFISIVGKNPGDIKWPDITDEMPDSIDKILILAMANSPEMIEARTKIDSLKKANMSVYSKFLPSVDLQLSQKWGKPNADSESSMSNNRTYRIVSSMKLGIGDFVNPAITSNDVSSATEGKKGSERKLSESIYSSWYAVSTQKDSLKLTKELMETYWKIYQAVLSEYEAGAKSLLEVMNNLEKYYNSQIKSLESKGKMMKAVIALVLTSGMFRADMLKKQFNLKSYIDSLKDLNNNLIKKD
jgi:outer membrane protein TolC